MADPKLILEWLQKADEDLGFAASITVTILTIFRKSDSFLRKRGEMNNCMAVAKRSLLSYQRPESQSDFHERLNSF
jgi:hypothetical protein